MIRLTGGPALAAGPTTPVADPIAPAPVIDTGGDWTGAYGGVQLGYADVNGSGTADGDDILGGVHVGYDFGRTLGYFTAGVADLDTSLGSETGEFYDLGVAYQVSDRYTIGAELLEHSFDDIGGTGVKADATTLTLHGSIRF